MNPEGRLREEIERRRTFAIISHPDAGKTTLTEKLLLYGGAIHLAGSVKARRAVRHAASDWMKLEQERGISVTSSVMQFEYAGRQVNLLDTPGHQDFSEDTYRTLIAADSAVMLLDNRKGVEERTRQLFSVCKRRRMPIVSFVNKCDRAGANPLQLLDDVESDLGIRCVPFTWPITTWDSFVGVFDRRTQEIRLFQKDAGHGARRVTMQVADLHAAWVVDRIGADAHARLVDELELLDHAAAQFDAESFLAGEMTPMFFGSALTNFGVEPFLAEFLRLAPAPQPRESSVGAIDPARPEFSGFVFKIQANMDPRHRDRVAFVRVCSGRFEVGMTVTHVRTGKLLRLASAQQFMARERSAVEEAWPGDVIGIHDRGALRIGDTLSVDGTLEFVGIPRFAPEHFARVSLADPLRRKQLDTGLRQLTEEGAAQVFFAERDAGASSPIVGAVGLLQFDVLLHRLEHEYGVPARLERFGYGSPRWVTGAEQDIERMARGHGRMRVYDAKGQPMILFADSWALRSALEADDSGVQFSDVAP